ncbi:MAG: mechanosensitive ion channel family protein [bacterium]|nr:mechanosensitive ion channel family protein [bacterium]MDE0600858.1 mechanosensitive ion channel family protein [bacterium]
MPFVVLAQTLTDACGAAPQAICRLVFDVTGSTGAARFADFAARPVKVVVILVIAWLANRMVRRWLNRAVEGWLERRAAVAEAARDRSAEASDRKEGGLREAALQRASLMLEQQDRSTQRTRTLGAVLRSIASIVIYGMAVMMSLAEFDVNLGPLIAGAGIVGVAVGFGAQSLVKDFLTGVFMLLEDQYGVGDVVNVGETVGVVEAVKLRTTQIRDISGTVWYIPNGEIRRVANLSQDWGRAVLDLEVAYDTDIEKAKTVIKEVADGLWREQLPHATITEEPTIAGIQSFGASAIAIRLMAKTEPGEHFATARELRGRIKAAFDEAGIEIPFPQRTVWMKTEQPPDGSTA